MQKSFTFCLTLPVAIVRKLRLQKETSNPEDGDESLSITLDEEAKCSPRVKRLVTVDMQSQRQSTRESQAMARSLADFMAVFRSVAILYSTREGRRAALARLLADIRFDTISRAYTVQSSALVPVKEAVVDFCLGHTGVHEFGRRVRKALRRRVDETDAPPTRRTGSGAVVTSRTRGEARSEPDHFWPALYDRLRTLIGTPREGTGAGGREARIEFARRFDMDWRAGMPALIHRPHDEGGHWSTVARDECIQILTSIGYLNKSMAGAGTEEDYPAIKYPVYVFGSNFVWIHSDAMYTLPRAHQRPPAFESDEQITTFVQRLQFVAGVLFVPDVQTCRRAATERNAPVLTSMALNDVSLQFSFAMPGGDLYTANVFYMDAANTCSSDLRYRRQYLSNVCHCENRLALWRVCVSVASLDGVPFDGLVGHSMSDFVVSMIQAFRQTKADQGAHFIVDYFTAVALVSYAHDSTALGGVDATINIAEDNSTASTCTVHNWLRAHSNPNQWRASGSSRITDLLALTPQVLVVRRPLLSEFTMAAYGANVFTKYKTFEDVFEKHVLLSAETLSSGLTDWGKTVAFKGGDGYWVFASDDRPAEDQSDGGEGPSWLHATADNFVATDSVARARVLDVLSVDYLFTRVFSAPSLLYVYSTVLESLGFNVTAAGGESPTLTFTHTEPDPSNGCTVFSSSPLVVIDANGRVDLPREPDGALRVLTSPRGAVSAGSVLDKHTGTESIVRSYRKTLISLNDFWPGVQAVKVSFEGPVLEHVNFVFFTAIDGSNAVTRLTGDGLTRLSRYNTNSAFQVLPAPVVYSLQRAFAQTSYAPIAPATDL